MAKRISLSKADCPVARSLDAVGDWWSLLIVRDAFEGAHRFSEFQKRLGVSKGILTARLRDLVALDILEIRPASDGSAYHDYVLTNKGRDLFPVVVALRQWGEAHCFLPGERHSVLVESGTGRRVGRIEIRSRNGQILSASDTTVRKLTKPPLTPKHSTGGLRKRRKAASRAREK